MQAPTSTLAKPAVGILFDSDFGNRIDSVLALALAYGFDSKNEARVVSISTSKANLKSAGLADAIARFYVAAAWGQFAGFARSLPIGYADDGKAPQETPLLTGTLSATGPDGKPLYPHGINSVLDTADPATLLRNALTAQHDQNAVVVLAGPATNLARLLALGGAKELIERKVRLLALMGGAYPEGGPEPHFASDVAAAQKVLAEWPTPIVAAGQEIGAKLPYPTGSLEKDFAWATAHPVVGAYRTIQPSDAELPTWDMAPVLYAIRGQQGYFGLSDPGTISVDARGRTSFKPLADGKHRHLVLDSAQRDKILEAYASLVSTKPVPRRPRFLQMEQEQQKPADPKPAEAKPPTK